MNVTKCNEGCPVTDSDLCCVSCQLKDTCGDVCPQSPDDCGHAEVEETSLEVFQSKQAKLIQGIANLVQQKALIEEAESGMREQLKTAMEAYGVKSFDNDLIKVTYMELSTHTSIDSTKLKAQQPEIYNKFSKTSPIKAFVKIELKKGK